MAPPKNGCALALASLFLLLPVRALADVDIAVQDGDKAKGTFDPATETETYRVSLPASAKLVAKAAGKKGVSVHLELFTESGSTAIATGVEAGPKSTLTFTAVTSGAYRVVATSRDGTTTGAYAIALSWTTPAKTVARRTMSAAPVTVAFSADAGSSVKMKVKAVAGSSAQPRVTKVTGPGFSADVNVGGASGSLKAGPVPLPFTGDYAVELTDAGIGGDVDVTLTLTPPKGKPRSIDLSSKAIGGLSGQDVAIGAAVGAEGGTVAVPDLGLGGGLDDISGSSVQIPPGALPSGGVIFIGTAPTLDPKGGDAPVGATVLLGPEGTKFGTKTNPVAVTVTIPIDASLLGADTSDVKIYTRDAQGRVTVVPPPYSFDLVGGTVSFPTPHFSSFVAARHLEEPTGGPILFSQLTGLVAPRDLVIDFTSANPNVIYFCCQGETVLALSATGTGSQLQSQLFAGGGSQTADGTARLSFDFPGEIQAIESDSDAVYVATATQIFRIHAATGTVSRFLGDGTSGDSGDLGPAISARMVSCTDLHSRQDGFMAVVDQGAARVRLIDNAGNIDTMAGTGASLAGDDGPDATISELDAPGAIVWDFVGQRWFLAERGRVRRIDTAGTIFTISGDKLGALGCAGGTGLGARYTRLSAIGYGYQQAGEGDALYLGDTTCDVIFRYRFADGTSEIVAGTANTPGLTPDFSPATRVNDPRGFFGIGTGAVIFLDAGNGLLRQLVIPQ